jgi:hypothetical protein
MLGVLDKIYDQRARDIISGKWEITIYAMHGIDQGKLTYEEKKNLSLAWAHEWQLGRSMEIANAIV